MARAFSSLLVQILSCTCLPELTTHLAISSFSDLALGCGSIYQQFHHRNFCQATLARWRGLLCSLLWQSEVCLVAASFLPSFPARFQMFHQIDQRKDCHSAPQQLLQLIQWRHCNTLFECPPSGQILISQSNRILFGSPIWGVIPEVCFDHCGWQGIQGLFWIHLWSFWIVHSSCHSGRGSCKTACANCSHKKCNDLVLCRGGSFLFLVLGWYYLWMACSGFTCWWMRQNGPPAWSTCHQTFALNLDVPAPVGWLSVWEPSSWSGRWAGLWLCHQSSALVLWPLLLVVGLPPWCSSWCQVSAEIGLQSQLGSQLVLLAVLRVALAPTTTPRWEAHN